MRMKKSEIKKLDDKDLQLRYFLGGLHRIRDGKNCQCDYWACEINCSCNAVEEDENFFAVKIFMKKHNITNKTFLSLAYNYLVGAIMKYHGSYSPLFVELEEVLAPYKFTHTTVGEIPDNDFREKELENLAHDSSDNNADIKEFISKYNLSTNDFITILKTNLNHNFYLGSRIQSTEDTFSDELYDISHGYGLAVTREYIEEYRRAYQDVDAANLVANARITQKRYLELMKELSTKYPNLATEMIDEVLNESIDYTEGAQERYMELMEDLLIDSPNITAEVLSEVLSELMEENPSFTTRMLANLLNELGFDSKKDVKRLIVQKRIFPFGR